MTANDLRVPSSQRKKRSRISRRQVQRTSRVVPTPKGRGDVQFTSFVAGPHAAIEASDVSCSQTWSGDAAKRFW